MLISRIRKMDGKKASYEDLHEFCEELSKTLNEMGFKATITINTRTQIKISNVRLQTDKWGYNISPYTGRRGNILNFYQWALVNYAVNVECDLSGLSAKITSLNGHFEIRDGTVKKLYRNWEDMAFDNVGSVVEPIMRIEAWKPEDYAKFTEQYKKALKVLLSKVEGNTELKDYIINLAWNVLGISGKQQIEGDEP